MNITAKRNVLLLGTLNLSLRNEVRMYARSFILSATWSLSWLAGPASAGLYPEDAVDRLAAIGMDNLGHYLNGSSTSKCTLETAIKRREWYATSRDHRDHPAANSFCAGAISALQSEKITPKLSSASRHCHLGMTVLRSQELRAGLTTL